MIGKIVIVRDANKGESNCHMEQPGIVTFRWSESYGVQYCNVKVFPDCNPPYDMTSVNIYGTKEDALASGTPDYCGWLA